MKLADKPCYPNKTCDEVFVGLTFRERLIVALAGNSSIAKDDNCTIAKKIISQADAIIKELEKEQ